MDNFYSSTEERDMNRNAHNVLAALSETPATTSSAASLMLGKHALSNEIYAKLVEVPGVYAGRDELSAYTSLARNKDKNFLVVDSDGAISTYRNGRGTPVRYTSENKAQILAQAIAGAEVALYKTQNHWERMAKPE